ncbi:hypothetical protein LTS18_000723, partial [Coniosporium uncinatum]
MSIDIHWQTLTAGPDGASLEEAIRAFIHDRFQQVTLPQFIRSVHVHLFKFGDEPPEIELKDICDPLPDFYDDDDDDDDTEGVVSDSEDDTHTETARPSQHSERGLAEGRQGVADSFRHSSGTPWTHQPSLTSLGLSSPMYSHGSARHNQLSGSSHSIAAHTPGILGGTSNLSYFHLPLGTGLSGTTTPLAAVAGAHFPSGWSDHGQATGGFRARSTNHFHHHADSNSSLTPPSDDLSSRPTSRHLSEATGRSSHEDTEHQTHGRGAPVDRSSSPSDRERESTAEDVQIVSH